MYKQLQPSGSLPGNRLQGVSYTTGVPAMIGAMMFFKGEWKRPGVNNVEEFNPDPFMEQLNKQGLPWHEEFDKNLEYKSRPVH